MSTTIIGQIINKQYKVEAYIASGGMKTVYKVLDIQRNVPLVMKMMHSDLEEDLTVLRGFERETRALKKLQHPNIVHFYGMERTGDTFFMLEEYIEGPSLKDVLKERKVLRVEEALVYFRALCAALGFAHANGVVHCDVKPGNVMINQGGNILLTDFGIARPNYDRTSTFAGAGTPGYMAPEQVRGAAVTAATDIYALGVLLFEMLTGQRPFKGNEAGLETAGGTQNERIRNAHLMVPPPDPRSLNPQIPKGLAQAILTALAKKPEERFAETNQFLRAVCEGSGIAETTIPSRVSLSRSPTPIAERSNPNKTFFRKLLDRLNELIVGEKSSGRNPSNSTQIDHYHPVKPPAVASRTVDEYDEDEATDMARPRKEFGKASNFGVAWLVSTDGPFRGRRIEIKKETTTFGRSSECDIQIQDDRSVSRTHCRIQYRNGLFIIMDLGSSVGTWVNNSPVRSPTALSDGDIIRLGDHSTFLFKPSQYQTKISELWDDLSSGIN